MTVSREILMHPDFMNCFADEICGMLEALIDEEFEKGDNTDFDFIDECADAINAIRSGDETQILPVISRKEFFKNIGIKNEGSFRTVVAACAAVAILFTAGTQIEVEENITVAQALSGIVSEFFRDENSTEIITTQPPETTTEAVVPTTTQKTADIIGISIEMTKDFKREYYVGEKFSANGLKVFGEYDNGERVLIGSGGYTVEVDDSFGTKPGYETVEISAGDYTETVEVRVIENVETKKLTSVYALFPDGFEFTAEDLNSIDLSSMQVYARYSDGSEKELTADEYTVSYEQSGTLFEKYVNVTVKYKICSCSFTVFKE